MPISLMEDYFENPQHRFLEEPIFILLAFFLPLMLLFHNVF